MCEGRRSRRWLSACFFLPDPPAAPKTHLCCGRSARGVELAERSIAPSPNWDSTYSLLIPAYVQLDRLTDAQAAVASFMALSPGTTVSMLRKNLPIKDPKSLNMILDRLKAAGLPE
jgi:adenylate cyclase